jgi:phenylpropionate dioxygenase-like ring-hydroxylating dioxygenase large terminal subunit
MTVNLPQETALTYQAARKAFRRDPEPLRKFANPDVVCEGWYPVHRASDIPVGEMKRAWIGKNDLVLYRNLQGSLHAVARACPHLGADLARGTVVQGGLRCAFHRWCWNPDGSCSSGDGAAEGRRIRTYEVRERWGLAWVWAGGEPRYELPEPSSSNTRHVLRLPPQRLGCHPHVMLGNGLDFTHVVPVHRFHMLEDPRVEVRPPHRLSITMHGRFGPTLLRKALGLAGRAARWRFTTIGPSLAWLTVTDPTPFELLWAGRPLPDGGCAAQTLFFLPKRVSFLRALPMMIATTYADRGILEGIDFRPGFVRSDAVFHLYARLIEDLPVWTEEPA